MKSVRILSNKVDIGLPVTNRKPTEYYVISFTVMMNLSLVLAHIQANATS